MEICNKVMNECNESFGDFSRLKPSTPKSTVRTSCINHYSKMIKKDKERAFKGELDDLIKKFRETSQEVIQKQ